MDTIYFAQIDNLADMTSKYNVCYLSPKKKIKRAVYPRHYILRKFHLSQVHSMPLSAFLMTKTDHTVH